MVSLKLRYFTVTFVHFFDAYCIAHSTDFHSPLLGGCYVYDGYVNLLHTQVGVNCGYIRCELWLYSGVNCGYT